MIIICTHVTDDDLATSVMACNTHCDKLPASRFLVSASWHLPWSAVSYGRITAEGPMFAVVVCNTWAELTSIAQSLPLWYVF